MAFKRKKISNGQTVGGRLKSARKKKKLSLEEAEEATRVRYKYLRAIEEDNWKIFPSRIYIVGFVRRYAEFLGLSSGKILDDFKKEFSLTRSMETLSPAPRAKETSWNRLVITPKLIFSILVLMVALGMIAYVIFAASRFSKPPTIEIIAPLAEKTDRKELVIEGKTQETAIVEINNQSVKVDEKGYFQQKVELTPGLNVFEIKAKSRIGKETNKVLRQLYEDKNPAVLTTQTITLTPNN